MSDGAAVDGTAAQIPPTGLAKATQTLVGFTEVTGDDGTQIVLMRIDSVNGCFVFGFRPQEAERMAAEMRASARRARSTLAVPKAPRLVTPPSV